MPLTLLPFTEIVARAAAAAQASTWRVLNFTPGSAFRAILEANGGIVLWLQRVAVQVMRASRLATSTGEDVDSWVAQFGLTRNGSVSATGFVTFGRAGSYFPALLPVGSLVKTTDGALSFAVTADPTNPLWADGLNGYTIPVGVATATLPVIAVQGGAAYNVQADAINLLASAVPGVDTVTNALAFENGQDPESDDDLKERFRLYVAGLSKATADAIGSAITNVQPGLTYTLEANVDPAGTPLPGHFVVTIDDGSGAPPSALISAVFDAVDKVRSIAETFNVQGPQIVPADIWLTIAVAPGVNKAAAQATVRAAITDYVDRLPVGALLPFSIIAKLAFDALPAGQITDVSAISINSELGDGATIRPGVTGKVQVSRVIVN